MSEDEWKLQMFVVLRKSGDMFPPSVCIRPELQNPRSLKVKLSGVIQGEVDR